MKYIRTLIGASLLLALPGGASSDDETARPLLNSERILQSFGSYGVHIVRQSTELRATCLYSGAGNDRVCRTLALVRFPSKSDPRLAASLESIRQGASLGSTLVAAGWQIDKAHGQIGRLASGDPGYPELQRFFGLSEPRPLAFHIYTLQATRGDLRLPVAELFEVHHPVYLSEPELREIYTIEDPTVTASIDDWATDLPGAFGGDAPFN